MNEEGKKNVISAELENVEISKRSSFHVGKYRSAYFMRPWHYHPEFELLLITKGYGTRMVGDKFEPFNQGDLVLVGGNLPHAWISDRHFIDEDTTETCESIYIQFRQSVFGTHFIDMPEMESIRTILKKAERGIKVLGKMKSEIVAEMRLIEHRSPLEQMLTLIRLLDMIQKSDYEVLASGNYAQQGIFKSEKMTKAHNYIMQNFKHEIDVNTCAAYLDMTTTSLCRFFKKQTNVTFTVYLNYLRINFAQKLLRNTPMPVKEIAFECGYVSHVYFNQIFKKMTGISPGEYRRRGLINV